MRTHDQDENRRRGHAPRETGISGVHREWSRIVHQWVRVIHAIFSRMKLPFTSMKVLLYLRLFQNDAEPSVIADFICVPRQTMTSILDCMEKEGWIIRRPHPSDRRRKRVHFTPAGRRLADRILKAVRDHEARAMRALAPEELAGMLRSMRRFSEAMERSVTGDAQAEGGSA